MIRLIRKCRMCGNLEVLETKTIGNDEERIDDVICPSCQPAFSEMIKNRAIKSVEDRVRDWSKITFAFF